MQKPQLQVLTITFMSNYSVIEVLGVFEMVVIFCGKIHQIPTSRSIKITLFRWSPYTQVVVVVAVAVVVVVGGGGVVVAIVVGVCCIVMLIREVFISTADMSVISRQITLIIFATRPCCLRSLEM